MPKKVRKKVRKKRGQQKVRWTESCITYTLMRVDSIAERRDRMTYVVPSTSTRQHRRPNTVDIAGIAWPVYKVEALVLGIAIFVGTLALTTSLRGALSTRSGDILSSFLGSDVRVTQIDASTRHASPLTSVTNEN